MNNLTNQELSPKGVKELMLDMLVWFDQFAKEHNLQYFLYAGTLIGAVRHKGFIPWDDDIDLAMLRPDYDRMIDIFKTEHTGRYQLRCFELNREYLYPFAKLSDSETTIEEEGKDCGVDLGVFIDIFPLDNDNGNMHYRTKLKKTTEWYNSVLDFKINTSPHTATGAKLLVAKLCDKVITQQVTELVQRKYRKKAMRFAKDENCPYVLAAGVFSPKRLLKKEWFREMVSLEFEEYQFSAPCGYHELLTERYGDYMQLPPLDQQVPHHGLHVYLKEEKQ